MQTLPPTNTFYKHTTAQTPKHTQEKKHRDAKTNTNKTQKNTQREKDEQIV